MAVAIRVIRELSIGWRRVLSIGVFSDEEGVLRGSDSGTMPAGRTTSLKTESTIWVLGEVG